MVAPSDIVKLERVFLATWRGLDVERFDGWVLSAADGVTGRANSATVLDLGSSIESSIVAMERWYRDRGLPPTFRLTDLSDSLRPMLVARGYEPWNIGCDVLVRELSDQPPVPQHVRIDSTPTDEWLEFGRFGTQAHVVRRMFERVAGPQAYAEVRGPDGAIVAAGQGMLADETLAVFGMGTAEHHRGQGRGRQVLAALEAWAATAGATRSALQVVVGNAPAQALYRRAGYERVYGYDYLQLP